MGQDDEEITLLPTVRIIAILGDTLLELYFNTFNTFNIYIKFSTINKCGLLPIHH